MTPPTPVPTPKTPPPTPELEATKATAGAKAKQPPTGIVKSVATAAEFEKEIKTHCGAYMKNSQGVVSVTIENIGRPFMGTDSLGTIYINTETLDAGNYGQYIPSVQLMSAWDKISRGEKLEWLEEYSIESLWHEITHNRQVYEDLGGKKTRKRFIAEIVTQWTARRTYPEFLEKLGGSAAHLDSIKSDGLGYALRIKKFDKLLEVLKVDETEMLTEMKRLIDVAPRDKYGKELTGFLNTKTGIEKRKIIDLFGKMQKSANFENALTQFSQT
jgi:hypothetical protein